MADVNATPSSDTHGWGLRYAPNVMSTTMGVRWGLRYAPNVMSTTMGVRRGLRYAPNVMSTTMGAVYDIPRTRTSVTLCAFFILIIYLNGALRRFHQYFRFTMPFSV